MADTGRGVAYLNADGGEGGTSAAPLMFADCVSVPFRIGFSRVYATFAERRLHHDVVFVGAGKLGVPGNAIVAPAGGDMINVGREAVVAIGCIQSEKCHTDRCPTGVATQNRWLTRGFDPTLKSARVGELHQDGCAGISSRCPSLRRRGPPPSSTPTPSSSSTPAPWPRRGGSSTACARSEAGPRPPLERRSST
jgi:hypothetical protein